MTTGTRPLLSPPSLRPTPQGWPGHPRTARKPNLPSPAMAQPLRAPGLSLAAKGTSERETIQAHQGAGAAQRASVPLLSIPCAQPHACQTERDAARWGATPRAPTPASHITIHDHQPTCTATRARVATAGNNPAVVFPD
jgi:hypothetical protein